MAAIVPGCVSGFSSPSGPWKVPPTPCLFPLLRAKGRVPRGGLWHSKGQGSHQQKELGLFTDHMMWGLPADPYLTVIGGKKKFSCSGSEVTDVHLA